MDKETGYQFIRENIKHVRWADNILNRYYYQYDAQPKAQRVFGKIANRLSLRPEILFNLCGIFFAYRIEHEGLGEYKCTG